MRTHLNRLAGATLLAAGFAAALTASSCTNPATEVVPGFTTQIQIPDELRSVVVVITQGGRPIRCRVYPVVDGSVSLPATIGIIPAEDRDGVPPEPVNISVLGYRSVLGRDFENECFLGALPNTRDDRVGDNEALPPPNEVMVVRRASLQYTEDKIVFTHMPLKESCADVFCEEDQTCVGGICESATLDATLLPEYRDDLVFGDANTCFNPELCLPTGQATILAVMTDKENCTFTLPIPDDQQAGVPRNPGALNVEVVYNTQGTEILDLDPREGFIFPDATDPWTFQLAPNVCESQFKRPADRGETSKILGVYASPVCTAKRALQPICTDALQSIQAGERGPASAAISQDLCSFGEPLQATESLLYVLMDRSASMGEFFGDGSLEFAVGIPLENPIAARTRFAFSFLPADISECGSGAAYETPLFGFGEPDTVRGDIASALGDPATVLPGMVSTDPQVNFDAALFGAYAALHNITDAASATFNRKAVVLLGNRDFQAHCAGATLEAEAAAQLANADPIHTYVAVLDAPADAPQFNAPSPQVAGAAIATAGGTEVFDAVADESEGALAVQKVLNDLGSCLYDPIVPPFGATPEDITHLSFVNPITQQSTLVERNAGCTAPGDPVDGFGYDSDNQVVICGQPCATLRSTLTDTAGYYAVAQLPAPAVPIVPSLSCTRKAELVQSFLLQP